MNEVVVRLMEGGMEVEDFRRLEFGRHKEVLERAGYLDIVCPDEFVIYVRTWANILEETDERSGK